MGISQHTSDKNRIQRRCKECNAKFEITEGALRRQRAGKDTGQYCRACLSRRNQKQAMPGFEARRSVKKYKCIICGIPITNRKFCTQHWHQVEQFGMPESIGDAR